MTLPNEFQAPTAANLSRATITELAVYVYQTALNFTGNAEYAETVLREFVTRAEAAAVGARNAAENAATDAAQIAAQTIRDIVAADADRAAASAQSARESEQNAAADAENASESATNAADAADRAEAAARTAAEDAVAEAVPAAADAIRAEVQADAASAASAATRAETAAQSAETSEGVCNSYAGGAAISAENAAQSAADAADSAADAQSAASDAASEFDNVIDEKVAAAVSALGGNKLTKITYNVVSDGAQIGTYPDGIYLIWYKKVSQATYAYPMLFVKRAGFTTEAIYPNYIPASIVGNPPFTVRVVCNSVGNVFITYGDDFTSKFGWAGSEIYKITEFEV